jgi:hypothetical protein
LKETHSMITTKTLALALLASPALLASAARAEDSGAPTVSDHSARTRNAAATGAFLPLTIAATTDARAAVASGVGGYDSARGAGVFEAAVEAHLFGPVTLRGGAVYSGAGDRLRPSFGARLQALREGEHGLDGTVGVFYRPEGLTEPEGEIEAALAAGLHAGRTYLCGNLVYGQDPEGRERDGEARVAALRPVGERLVLGLDGRLRLAIGGAEPRYDVVAGPAASVLVGPVALLLQVAATAVDRQGRTAAGVVATGGFGAAF